MRWCRFYTGGEFLDLVHNAIDIASPNRMIHTGKLDEARARNPLGKIAPSGELHARVLGAVHNERWDADT